MDVSRHRADVLERLGDRRPGRRGRLHEGSQHVQARADAEWHAGGGRLLSPRGRGSPAVVHAAEPEPRPDRPEWHERPLHLHGRPQPIPRLPRSPAGLPGLSSRPALGRLFAWPPGQAVWRPSLRGSVDRYIRTRPRGATAWPRSDGRLAVAVVEKVAEKRLW